MPGEALSLHTISFSYNADPFIDHLDLTFESSCVTGLVGPNGCGKSTLIKLAGGLLMPQRGQVKASGQLLSNLRPSARARIVATLPQDTPPVAMSVGNLALSGRYTHLGLLQIPTSDDLECATEALELAGVAALRNRPVHSLSGGQRQRAYLAMLLAQRAPVMLLDEPTAALDIRAAHDTLALIRSIREKRDASVVIVMHDLDLALRYCDRLAVMDAGRIIAHGPTAAVISHGALEDVFRISICRHNTPTGSAYTFSP